MNQICVSIPDLHKARTVELEITVEGRTHFMNYRVESLDWSGVSETGRIDKLRDFIRTYDKHWELVSIGRPSGSLVPVTFRQRRANKADVG